MVSYSNLVVEVHIKVKQLCCEVNMLCRAACLKEDHVGYSYNVKQLHPTEITDTSQVNLNLCFLCIPYNSLYA